MGTRPKSKRWRRLERWQVLLAAVVAAVASIIVALVNLPSGQSAGSPHPTPSLMESSSSSGNLPVIAITGLSEQPSSPPPSRRYTWDGTERNLPSDAAVFVIGKLSTTAAAAPQASTGSQPWLVSPQALISKNGTWTVTWIIPNPPSAVTWSAVAQIPSEGPFPTVSQCPSSPPCPPLPSSTPNLPPYQLSSRGPNAPGVVTTATYHP
jgi:hypothetical protein